MGCAAGEIARGEGGKASEVGAREEESIEPIYPPFVSGASQCCFVSGRWDDKRFSQVIQGRDALRGRFLNVLEYDVWVRSGGERDGSGGAQSAHIVVHAGAPVGSGVLPPQTRLRFTAI